MLAVVAAASDVAAAQSSSSCPAVYNDTLATTGVHLEGAHQLAVLARKLEETEHLLHLSVSHPPNSGFRYGTFLLGMLVALLLMGTAAMLSWEYIRKQLLRKQQVAVVGGLKDMDDKTLKKVLGSVCIPIHCPCLLWMSRITLQSAGGLSFLQQHAYGFPLTRP